MHLFLGPVGGAPLSELSWPSSLAVVAVSFSGLFTFIFLMLACLCCKKGDISFKVSLPPLVDLLHPSNWLEKFGVDEKLNLEPLASARFFKQPLLSEMSIRVFTTEIKSLLDLLAQMEEVKQRNRKDRNIWETKLESDPEFTPEVICT